MDFQAYYKNVREKREQLTRTFPSGCCVVLSVYNLAANSQPGGITECDLANAARIITDGTHRLATDKEAADFYSQRDAERARRAPGSVSRVQALFDEAMKSV